MDPNKINKKTINIPIYGFKLTIIFNKNLDGVIKKYKLTGNFEDLGALTFESDLKYRHIIVAFNDASDLSIVAHEIVHIKNYIFLRIGATVDLNNDEPEAYLTGWLFNQINDLLKKFRSE